MAWTGFSYYAENEENEREKVGQTFVYWPSFSTLAAKFLSAQHCSLFHSTNEHATSHLLKEVTKVRSSV